MSENNKLILVDLSYLTHRAWYAIPQTMRTPDGQPSNVVYGVAQMLAGLIERERPTYLALAGDGPGPTFRHTLYPGYKAGRPAMAADMRSQLPLVKELAAALGLPLYQQDNTEADDVIASLTKLAVKRDIWVEIVTGDKDLLSLVRDENRVSALMPMAGAKFSDMARLDVAACKAKWGFDPYFWPSYKCLAGDKSDGIPGVPGIGDKTAKELINRFGTVGRILWDLHLVKPEKLQDLLRDNRDEINLYLKLVSLVDDLPWVTVFDHLLPGSLAIGQGSYGETKRLFKQWGFSPRLFDKFKTLFTADRSEPEPEKVLVSAANRPAPEPAYKVTATGQLAMF
jgi:DNA polymerase-1